MIWGTYDDLRSAVKRLEHFAGLFKVDGPFTALTPFGRNLALFHDFGDPRDYIGDFVLCAGAGKILSAKCDLVRIMDDDAIQSEIASWWWRANEHCNWHLMS